jgi:DNA polymerase
MGYSLEDVFICNIVKCRPPDNREPFNDEVASCIGFIKRQIALINPKVIITLGGTATTKLLNSPQRITQLRGRWQMYNGIKVMPTYHPSYLLRTESAKADAWKDLKMVMAELAGKG